MGVDAGLYMYIVIIKSSRLLSHLLMSSCTGARDDGVALASAGPYANHLHLTPDR